MEDEVGVQSKEELQNPVEGGAKDEVSVHLPAPPSWKKLVFFFFSLSFFFPVLVFSAF